MSESALGGVLQFLNKACALQGTCDLTDRQLMERFISQRDEGAFTFLVRRHGPMIFNVCRQFLGNAHEAEDAVQAAFLVMIRRTDSIRRQESVGSWLYGVAKRIALRSHAQNTARRSREREAATTRAGRSAGDNSVQELHSALHEAIGSLPDKYRAPIVLCYLEGRSMERAARELNCPKTSLARLLEKGREMLRGKLERRGFILAALALTTALTKMAAAAPLPVSLTIKTVKAATLVATGKAVASGFISAHVLALTDGAIKGVFVMKAKMIILTLTLGLAVGGAGWYGYKGYSASPQSSPTAKAQPGVVKEQKGNSAKNDTPVSSKDEDKGELIAGIVVDEAGKPMAGAEVEFKKYPAPVRAVSQKDGTFQMRMEELPTYGLFYVKSRDGKRLASLRIGDPDKKIDWQALHFKLKPARILEVAATDAKGQPVPSARTGVLMDMQLVAQALTDAQGRALLPVPPDDAINHVYAYKPGAGFDYRSFEKRLRNSDPRAKAPAVPNTSIKLQLDGARTLRVQVVDSDGILLAKLPLYPWYFDKPGETTRINFSGATDEFGATTNEAGIAVWDWMPPWIKGKVTIWPHTKEYSHRRLMWEIKDGPDAARLVLDRFELLRGKVTHADGSPAAGINIRAASAGYEFDSFHGETKSGPDGKYEMRVAPNLIYLVAVADKAWAAEPQTGFAVLPKTALPDKNFVLRPVTTITGQVTLGNDRKPYPGQNMILYLMGKDLHSLPSVNLPNKENKRIVVQPILTFLTTTDREGRYEFRVGPGQYDLFGSDQIKRIKVTVTDELKLEFNFNAPREEKGLLKGLVVTGTPATPVADATIAGIYRAHVSIGDLSTKTDIQGRFEAERSQHRMVLRAISADGKLAGVVEIGPDDATVTLPLTKVATARGRLLDGKTGEPMPNREIRYGVRVPVGEEKFSAFRTGFGNTLKTDAEGNFELSGLVAGQKYYVDVTIGENGRTKTVHTMVASPGASINVGDVKLAPEYRPPTIDESRKAAFDVKGTPLERFENARRDAKLGRLHVLTILAPTKSALTERLFTMTRERDELSRTMDDFRTLWVATDDERRPAAMLLSKKLGRDLKDDSPVLVVADERGELVAVKEAGLLQKDGMLDLAMVAKFLEEAAPAHLDANKLLADALAQAKKENKRVIVQETATWCGPCWKLSRFLDQHRDIWEKDYLWIKLDHRWTGALDIAKRLRGKSEGGIPWTAILDESGKVLITSNDKEGANIGFPGDAADSINHFTAMIRATAQRLTEADIARLADALKAAKGP